MATLADYHQSGVKGHTQCHRLAPLQRRESTALVQATL
jgi:hypothetical protein